LKFITRPLQATF